MSRSEQIRADAKRLEDKMRSAGEVASANTIRRLLASHGVAISTLKTLHRDNMRLRKQLGLPSYLDAKEGGGSPSAIIASAPQTPPPPKPKR